MRISDWSSDVCSSDLFGPTVTVRIGAVEQGYMGRRVSELDLLEHSLPYVGGQKIGTAGQGVAEVEVDCLGIGEDPAGLMVDEGRYGERVEPFGINRRLPSERADRTVLGCGFRSQPQPDILRTIILILRGKDRQLVGDEGHAQDRKSTRLTSSHSCASRKTSYA